MSKKKKSSNEKRLTTIVLITAILNLIHSIFDIIEKLLN